MTRTLNLKTKINTRLFSETEDYYRRLFGMEVAEAWNHPGYRGTILAFPDPEQQAEEPPAAAALLEIYYDPAAHDFSGLSLQFMVEDLDSFVASLPIGIESDGPRDRPWGARYLYLRDPNGILVIVYEGCL